MRERIILHLDMDAFFASVEERDKPWLKGKPIVVGADPKEGKGRGVVSTANYAARKYGIHSAMPISTAWRLSEQARSEGMPLAVFLTGTYHKYGETSARIIDIFRAYVDIVEPASIDEAYSDVSSLGSYVKARVLAAKIKKEILAKEKLTCSVGIGPNKLVAKIAAGSRKPDGLTVVTPAETQDFLDSLAAKELPGVGPKSAEVLTRHNIHTVKDLRSAGAERLTEWFGKWGGGIYERANGRDDSPVVEEYETKSRTFFANIPRRDTGKYLAALGADVEGVSTAILRDIRDNVPRGIGRIPKGCGPLPLPLRYASVTVARWLQLLRQALRETANRSQRGWGVFAKKVLGEQETFETDTRDAAFLLGRLKAMCGAVAERARREGFQWKTVSITVRFHDFQTQSRTHTIKNFSDSTKMLELEAVRLFLPFLDVRENPRKKSMRLLGVRVEHLAPLEQRLL